MLIEIIHQAVYFAFLTKNGDKSVGQQISMGIGSITLKNATISSLYFSKNDGVTSNFKIWVWSCYSGRGINIRYLVIVNNSKLNPSKNFTKTLNLDTQ